MEHGEILAPMRHDINTVINDFLLQALGASIRWARPMPVLNVVLYVPEFRKGILGTQTAVQLPKTFPPFKASADSLLWP